ncbi:unnamed protein product [Fusarium langsethiae]|nr:unnamed protein product [Fusarium langsethiae]GKU12594.1 unnamed protein product [Fusarium langsethiae]
MLVRLARSDFCQQNPIPLPSLTSRLKNPFLGNSGKVTEERQLLNVPANLGNSRLFSFKDGGICRDINMQERHLKAAREQFPSIRQGTGRRLLNTNEDPTTATLSLGISRSMQHTKLAVEPPSRYAYVQADLF